VSDSRRNSLKIRILSLSSIFALHGTGAKPLLLIKHNGISSIVGNVTVNFSSSVVVRRGLQTASWHEIKMFSFGTDQATVRHTSIEDISQAISNQVASLSSSNYLLARDERNCQL
jgi:hypothetical protein